MLKMIVLVKVKVVVVVANYKTLLAKKHLRTLCTDEFSIKCSLFKKNNYDKKIELSNRNTF